MEEEGDEVRVLEDMGEGSGGKGVGREKRDGVWRERENWWRKGARMWGGGREELVEKEVEERRLIVLLLL